MISSATRFLIRTIANTYDSNINVEFLDDQEFWGLFDAPNNLKINSHISDELAFRVFFHELGHWFCYRNHLFSAYHRKSWMDINKKVALAYFVKVERWVDSWAKDEYCKTFGVTVDDWVIAYSTRKELDRFKAYIAPFLSDY